MNERTPTIIDAINHLLGDGVAVQLGVVNEDGTPVEPDKAPQTQQAGEDTKPLGSAKEVSQAITENPPQDTVFVVVSAEWKSYGLWLAGQYRRPDLDFVIDENRSCATPDRAPEPDPQ